MIDWTKPLVVAGTDRVATVEQKRGPFGEYAVKADWVNTGNSYTIHFLEHGISRGNSYRVENAVTNAPQIGPEHIEALAEAIEETAENHERLLAFARPPRNSFMDHAETAARYRALAEAAEQRAALLAEIRAYLEGL